MTTHHFSFLHGFLGTPNFWQTTQNHLNVAYPHAICEALNLPGHGLAPQGAATPMPKTFNDAINWYADHIRPKTPCWGIGYSMGARLTLGTALHHPELFAGVIVISAHPGLDSDTEKQTRARWETQLISLLQNPSMTPLVNYFETLPIFESQQSVPGHALARQRQNRLSHCPKKIIASIGALGLANTPPMSSLLQYCKLPTLLITGALDYKYTAIARELSHKYTTVAHMRIPNAGHNAMLEAPEQTNDAILSFVNQHALH